MTTWIPYPTVLTGQVVELQPLETIHFPALIALAADARIWAHYVYDASVPGKMESLLTQALAEREKGTQFPFVIINKTSRQIIGSTRLMEIQPAHRKLEIGTTWMHPEVWGSAVNLDAKLLLLTFCFETLKTLRVQFRTDVLNLRSRKAIEKIGGVFEGIIRNDLLRENNTNRDSALYSMVVSEWLDQKQTLGDLLMGKLK